jgi:hypothetical protein
MGTWLERAKLRTSSAVGIRASEHLAVDTLSFLHDAHKQRRVPISYETNFEPSFRQFGRGKRLAHHGQRSSIREPELEARGVHLAVVTFC